MTLDILTVTEDSSSQARPWLDILLIFKLRLIARHERTVLLPSGQPETYKEASTYKRSIEAVYSVRPCHHSWNYAYARLIMPFGDGLRRVSDLTITGNSTSRHPRRVHISCTQTPTTCSTPPTAKTVSSCPRPDQARRRTPNPNRHSKAPWDG